MENSVRKNNIASKSWKIKKLGELCVQKEGLRRGPFGSAIKKQFFVPEGYKVYEQSNAIYNDANRGNYFIDEQKYRELINFNVVPGDLIVSCSGSLGRIAEIPTNAKAGVINQALLRIRLIDTLISKKYFLHYFRSAFFQKLIFDQSQGTAMANLIGIKDFKEIELHVPALDEQTRIVNKIEELFSELDKGVEELKKAQQQLKVYRQAVLNSSIPRNSFTEIRSVIEKLDQGWSPKCENHSSSNKDEWAVIKTTAVQSGNFLENENKVLPNNLEARKQHELKRGDILITRAGPRVRVGVCCLVKNVRPKLLNCDKVYRIRVNENVLIPQYLEVVLNSPVYTKKIEELKTGINDSGVNLTQEGFLNIQIPISSIEEQMKIVQEIESRLSVCDKIEETISNSLKEAEMLRQSILKKAFEGEL